MLHSEGGVKAMVTPWGRIADRNEEGACSNSGSCGSHRMFDPGRGEGYALAGVRRMSWPSWR
jgi:hypothetical protein